MSTIETMEPMELLLDIVHKGLLEAVPEIMWQDRMADFTDEDFADVEIDIYFEVGEAGGYDYAVDALGHEVGEGWVGSGFPEVRIIQATPERLGDQTMCHGCGTFVCYDTPACSV